MDNLEELSELSVRIAGRDIHGGWDRLARYCGMRWSDRPGETWAFQYYDAIPPRSANDIAPLDVAAAGALSPGLTRAELAWFYEHRRELNDWIVDLPDDVILGACEPAVTRQIAEIATWDAPVGLPLLTKVLHRKRPKLIPLLDRHILEHYRPVTGDRTGPGAWNALLVAMAEDLDLLNFLQLFRMTAAIEEETFTKISILRAIDVITWMGHRS